MERLFELMHLETISFFKLSIYVINSSIQPENHIFVTFKILIPLSVIHSYSCFSFQIFCLYEFLSILVVIVTDPKALIQL